MKRQEQQWRHRAAALGRCLASLGAVGVVVSQFLPWVRSGSALRSSFETWRTADRLGVLDGPVLPLLAGIWVVIPALAGVLCVATITGRRTVALASGLAVGGVVGVGALLVLMSPAGTEVGVDAAIICSLATVVGALLAGVAGRGTT